MHDTFYMLIQNKITKGVTVDIIAGARSIDTAMNKAFSQIPVNTGSFIVMGELEMRVLSENILKAIRNAPALLEAKR